MKHSRWIRVLFAGLMVALNLSALVPQPVQAAGEDYRWVNASTIEGSGGSYPSTITFTENSGTYQSPQINIFNCSIRLTIKNISASKTSATLDPNSTCGSNNLDTNITISNASAATTPAQNDDVSCDVGVLSWLVCPVIVIITESITELENVIVSLLATSPIQATDSAGNETNIHKVWEAFRNLASVAFIIVFFLMIFGNALGIDNYTVKKVMPRLVAAAILVQFSFFIIQIAVDISNVLGAGIAGIFDSLGLDGAGSSDGAYKLTGFSAFGLLAGAIGVGAVASGVGVALLVPIGLTLLAGIISILGALITLQARQVIIQLLAIAAPIAFVAWILPNTERLFKLWWSNLLKLLLMYPLIVLLIQAGNLVSTITSTIEAGTVQQLLAALVPIIVFFMIPATFKMGGSLMTMASGAIQKRSQKASKGIMGSQLMKDSKASLQRKALINYDRDEGKLPRALGGERELGKAFALRGGRLFNRAAGGHAFSLGEEGDRKLRRGITHAKQEINKDNMESLAPFMLGNDELMQIAMSEGEDFSHFKDGSPLTDRKGNPVKLKNDTHMKAAALRMAADAGGTLEVAKYFDQVYDRTPTADNNWRGKWRDEALGNSRADNQEIFFSAFGPNASSLLKAAPQFNPGKGTTAFDTETADSQANSHQTAAIPRQQQIFLSNPTQLDRRKKDAITRLQQIIENPNLASKADKKDILAFKALANAYDDVEVEEINGVQGPFTGKDLINTMLSKEGNVKNPKFGTLPPPDPLTGADIADKEIGALYDYYNATGSVPTPNQLGNGLINTGYGPTPPPPGAGPPPPPANPGPTGPSAQATPVIAPELPQISYERPTGTSQTRTSTVAGVEVDIPRGNIPTRGGGHSAAPMPQPTPIGTIVQPQTAPAEPTPEVEIPEAQPEENTPLNLPPVEAPIAPVNDRRPGGVRANYSVNRQATTTTGQAPLVYYKLNDLGRWEPISQATYQSLQEQYKGDPEKMQKIQARRGNR